MCTARTPLWVWRGWGTVHFFRVLWGGDGGGGRGVGPGCWWVGQLAYCTWLCLVWSCLGFLSMKRARTHASVPRLDLCWSSHRGQLCIFLTTVTHGHMHRLTHTDSPTQSLNLLGCSHLSMHQWLQNQLCYLLAMLTRLDLWADYDSSGLFTEQIEITWSPFESCAVLPG